MYDRTANRLVHVSIHLICSLQSYIPYSNSRYFRAKKRINTARKERGWTSERLAEACSINATYLRQIEAGTKVPSLPVFVSLCAALNVSPTYLLVEVLPQQGNQDMDALLELLQNATPKQLNMMVSMLRGALEASRE